MAPFCKQYNYAGGTIGLGCGVTSGYTVSVFAQPQTSPASAVQNSSTSSSLPTTSSISPPTMAMLSTGALTGIVVGSVAGAILLLIGALLLRRHYRRYQMLKRRSQVSQSGPFTEGPPWEPKDPLPFRESLSTTSPDHSAHYRASSHGTARVSPFIPASAPSHNYIPYRPEFGPNPPPISDPPTARSSFERPPQFHLPLPRQPLSRNQPSYTGPALPEAPGSTPQDLRNSRGY